MDGREGGRTEEGALHAAGVPFSGADRMNVDVYLSASDVKGAGF